MGSEVDLTPPPSEAREAIRGELDQWDGCFRIDVGRYQKDIELKRRLKGDAVRDLVTLFDRWQHSTESFEQSVAIEMRDAGRTYLETYLAMARRVAQGDFMAVVDSPIIATVVENMLDLVPRQVPRADHLQRCANFSPRITSPRSPTSGSRRICLRR